MKPVISEGATRYNLNRSPWPPFARRSAAVLFLLLGALSLPGAELLNPGFETDPPGSTISDWQNISGALCEVSAAPFHSGSRSFACSVPVGGSYYELRSLSGIPVRSGSYVHVSAWVQATSGSAAVNVFSYANAPSFSPSPMNGAWRKCEYNGKLTYNDTFYARLLSSNPGSAVLPFYWDDVVFYTNGASWTDTTAPAAPASASVASPTSSSLTVSWTASTGDGETADASGVGGYIVLRGLADPSTAPTSGIFYKPGYNATLGNATAVYRGSAVSFTDTGLSEGVRYYYKVYAFDAALNYSSSASANGQTTVSCASPTASVPAANPGATVCAGTAITLTETATGGLAPYAFQWKRNGAAVTDATASSFVVAAPVNNDTYTCDVRSSCGGSWVASPTLTLVVNPLVTPSVSVAANPGLTVCPGAGIVFTATGLNAGSTPSFQWYKNGSPVGSNSSSWSDALPADGDQVWVTMTSSAACANPAQATSTAVQVHLTASVTPSVSVSANPGSSVCSGSTVVFTATGVNAGVSPQYEWRKNGQVVGGSGSFYTDAALADGDRIDCRLYSSDSCASPSVADAAPVVMTVKPLVTASVAVTVSPGVSVCAGTTVTFTAETANAGSTAAYQWERNGAGLPGATGSAVSLSDLSNDDEIRCVLVPSGEICATSGSVTSAVVKMVVRPVLAPSVTVVAEPGRELCLGVPVTFRATALNCGSAPVYQWERGGNAVPGATASAMAISDLTNGESVRVVVTPSSDACGASGIVNSAVVQVVVNGFTEGAAAVVFREDAGSPAATVGVNSYTGWKNGAPMVFGTSGGTEVRTSAASSGYTGASGGGNVTLGNASYYRDFMIGGINTLGMAGLELWFGFYVDRSDEPNLVIEVSADGTTWSALTTPTAPSVTGWGWVRAAGTIPAAENLRIRFRKDSIVMVRLDDIELRGLRLTAAEPRVTAEGATRICAGGSVRLTASAGTAWEWSTGERTQSVTVSPAVTTDYRVVITDPRGCTGEARQVVQVNREPAGVADTLSTRTNLAVSVSARKLMANDSDPDGDTLTVVSVGEAQPAGASVEIIGGVVTYRPAADWVGQGGFSYVLSDGCGASANVQVSVTVTGGSGGGVSANLVGSPYVDGATHEFVVRFAGIPGQTYTVEWSPGPNGPWSRLANKAVGVADEGFGVGVFEVREATGGASERFYRTVWPAY